MEYKFLDIGCSSGGSLAWGQRYFGGKGLGIDVDPAKVAKARAAGQDAIVADARELNYPDSTFRFALFFDMLEHLPDAQLARDCVTEAYRVSRDFVLIRGPNFDGEAALREVGVKRYYTDWSGHTWHHRAADFLRLIDVVKPTAAVVLAHQQLSDLGDPDLLPLSAPANASRYNAEQHGPKAGGPLPIKVFSRIVCVMAKSRTVNVHEMALLATGSIIYTPTAGTPAADAPVHQREPEPG